MLRNNRFVLTLALLIVLLPFVLPGSKNGSFTGADDQAGKIVARLQPGYHPWVTAFWTPPSNEIASLLFALQAALGSGLIGYYAGLRRGRRQAKESQTNQDHARS
ncbi:MAG: energy-coupling factor ABC transporter substrate-binding protein [Magnetococcales bacterium]|nr:energy-coupling factor ABC transporter substrate-binding protein [Magnetococcales bacterium]